MTANVNQEVGMYETIVLGAGISGLVATIILQQRGCNRILIIDGYRWVGGNHIDCDLGPFTFDIDTLIFQDDSPLMKHFPELLDHYHPITPGFTKLLWTMLFGPIPFQ